MIYISSDEIPSPLEHVSQGEDVLLTKVSPLSHATEKLEDLQFAIEFKDWRMINYLQFQEALDLDRCLCALVQALLKVKGAPINTAAEVDALSELYASAKTLEGLCDWDADEEQRHSLTARSPRLRTIGLPLSVLALGVHEAAAGDRSLLLDKLIVELKEVRADPFPLEFRRFRGIMHVSSLRDVQHVLTATKPHAAPRCSWTTKVLITGARLGEASEMLDIVQHNREVAGWDITEPTSSWEQNGWEVYTHTSFEELLLLSEVDEALLGINWWFTYACENEVFTDDFTFWLQNECARAARRLMQAHALYPDFSVLDLPGVAHAVEDVGSQMPGDWEYFRDLVRNIMRDVMGLIASARERRVDFTIQ